MTTGKLAMILVAGALAVTESFAACTGTATHICVDHNGVAFVVNGTARGALSFVVGTTYEFELNSGTFSFHPFVLTTNASGGPAAVPLGASDGISGPNPANTAGQIVRFTPVRAGRFYYQCNNHLNMGGPIDVTAPPPVISALTNQIIHQNTSTGPLPFTVGSSTTGASNLVVTGLSSNVTLVPTSNISFGGSGSNRTLTVLPATNQTGSSRISVVVSNTAGGAATNSFLLTVIPFRLQILQRGGSTNVLQFDALSNRTYALEQGDSVDTASWTSAPIPSPPTNRPVLITNDVRGVSRRYYRLTTPRTP